MVVIAALFVAFAVVAAAIVERNTTLQLITQRDTATAQLTRLHNAIIAYSVFNKSGTNLLYPCPALTTLPTSDVNFGKDVATANLYTADCSSTAGDTGANPSSTVDGLEIMGVAGASTIRGMVPVQALLQYGASINDAFDPWNNRIMYVVNRNVTKGGTFAQDTLISLVDPRTGAVAIPSPDFILISYGRDGVGATKRGATTPAITCSNASTVFRLENCDRDVNFRITPTYTASGASGTATAISNTIYFDDILTHFRQ